MVLFGEFLKAHQRVARPACSRSAKGVTNGITFTRDEVIAGLEEGTRKKQEKARKAPERLNARRKYSTPPIARMNASSREADKSNRKLICTEALLRVPVLYSLLLLLGIRLFCPRGMCLPTSNQSWARASLGLSILASLGRHICTFSCRGERRRRLFILILWLVKCSQHKG